MDELATAPEVDDAASPGVRARTRTIGRALGPIAALALAFAPGVDLDPAQRRVAAVCALTAIYWITEAIPVAAASLLPAALLPLTGAVPAEKVAPAYFDDLVLLFLGAFLLALGLERWGVHRRMALAVIARVGSQPRRLVLSFLIATAALSSVMNNTATALLMLPIATAVIDGVRARSSGLASGGPFSVAMVLAVAYGATFGGLATPVGTAPNQVFIGHFHRAFPDAPPISFGAWVLGWMPMVAVLVVVAWLLMTRVLLRVPDLRGGDADRAVRAERDKLGPLGRGERWMAAIFALTAVLWMTRGELDFGAFTFPGWSRGLLALRGIEGEALLQHRRDVTDATVAVAMAILCFLIPVDRRRGVHLLDWSVAKKVPWDVLLLIGAGFALADGVRQVKLDARIGEVLAPLFAEVSIWVWLPILVALVVFLSEITSNTATASVLIPVFARAAVSAGMHPLLTMAPVAIASSGGFMLPVSTPPNALAYSTRMVPMRTMVRVGIWINLCMIVLVTVFFLTWVRRVWGIGDELPEWAKP